MFSIISKTFRKPVDLTQPSSSVVSELWLAKQDALREFREWLKATNQKIASSETVEIQTVLGAETEVDILVTAVRSIKAVVSAS